jgi:hypothetical protein
MEILEIVYIIVYYDLNKISMLLICSHFLSLYPRKGIRYAFIAKFIQGVTGGTDYTSGECFVGHTIPI